MVPKRKRIKLVPTKIIAYIQKDGSSERLKEIDTIS